MMHSTSSISNDIVNLVQNIENITVKRLQQACSDIVINLNLRDNFGRTISAVRLRKLISNNKKITTFLFDDISKQAIAIFTIITQGTPRIIYTNLSGSKKYLYQTLLIQSIITEEFGNHEDEDNSSLLVQISMTTKRSSNPQLVIKNLLYNSTVTVAVLTSNAFSTLLDVNFIKCMAGYAFFFPVYPFVMFFAPWPVLLVYPFSLYITFVVFKTLNQLVDYDDN